MQRWKKILVLSGSLLCLLVLVLLVFSRLTQAATPEARATKFLTAVLEKDWQTAKKICPSYSDGSQISAESYQLFFSALTKKKQADFLLEENNFKQAQSNSFFSETVFLPVKAYLRVSSENAQDVIKVSSKKNSLRFKEGRSRPLIPHEYVFDFVLENPTLGELQQRKKVTVAAETDYYFADRSLFVQSSAFQKQMLLVVSNFYQSYNQCIRNNLDFSGLESTEAAAKQDLVAGLEILKPYLATYSQSFQTLILNSRSLKITGGGKTVVFDLYIDKLTKVTFDGRKINAGEDRPNATATLVYDEEKKSWLVKKIDFETYSQDPKNWLQQQKIQLDQPNQANWSSESAQGLI